MPRESRAPNLREHEARRIFAVGAAVVPSRAHKEVSGLRARPAEATVRFVRPATVAASFAGFEPGRVVLEHLSQSTRGKGAIREGKLVVWTHTIAEIVRHTRPVGPVDFAAQNLVYDIACEASIMGAIPQAILRPQRKACSHRRPSMHDVW